MAEGLRYYFDEHVHSAIAHGLQARGIFVLTAQAAGRAGKRIPDDEQLAYARAQRLVLSYRSFDPKQHRRHPLRDAQPIMLPHQESLMKQ